MIYQIACAAGRREGSVAGEGLKRIFENQIIGILSVSTAVNRIDTNEGTYAHELYEASAVLAQVTIVSCQKYYLDIVLFFIILCTMAFLL